MKHPMRTVVALSAALMAAGAALAMFGAAGGGSAQGSLVRGLLDTLHIGGNRSAYVLASAEAEPGKTYGLCVEAGAGEFTVAVGDEFRVDASRPDAVEAQMDGDTFRVRTKNAWGGLFGGGLSVAVTVPRDVQWGEVTLDVDAGSLDVEGLAAQTLACSVDAGSMELRDMAAADGARFSVDAGGLSFDGALAGQVEVSVEAGGAELDAVSPAGYGYAIEGSLGAVTLNGETAQGLEYARSENPDADTFYTFACSVGSIEADVRTQ